MPLQSPLGRGTGAFRRTPGCGLDRPSGQLRCVLNCTFVGPTTQPGASGRHCQLGRLRTRQHLLSLAVTSQFTRPTLHGHDHLARATFPGFGLTPRSARQRASEQSRGREHSGSQGTRWTTRECCRELLYRDRGERGSEPHTPWYCGRPCSMVSRHPQVGAGAAEQVHPGATTSAGRAGNQHQVHFRPYLNPLPPHRLQVGVSGHLPVMSRKTIITTKATKKNPTSSGGGDIRPPRYEWRRPASASIVSPHR
jgi:hypothetical protein